jgi:hypothetical protein
MCGGKEEAQEQVIEEERFVDKHNKADFPGQIWLSDRNAWLYLGSHVHASIFLFRFRL